ncbi:MAG TPA: hypothetical protein VK619_01245 [Pyrinomonadaceae bacterium]|nr:hypothetical protein [Pyrinomonadaceae bacterium]
MPAPKNYVTAYKTLTVTVPGEICGEEIDIDVGPINVIRYSNTGTSGTPKQKVAGLDDGSKDMVLRFLSAYKREKDTKPFPDSKLPANFSNDSINNVYSGKGSPQDIRATLLLYACYEEKIKGVQTRRKWQSPSALESALNSHCVDRIGLDCLGFVVNFVNDDRSKHLSSDLIGLLDMEYFTGYVKGAKKLRDSLANLTEKDVIVYLHKGDLGQQARHIAVVDTVFSKSPEKAQVIIAESYGGVGPQVATIALENFNGGDGNYGTAFILNRSGMESKVYLVPA